MPDNSFHGCLTDPPYGLSFMGHMWDHGVPSAEVWREVLRVLRPGAHLLAFGGTRTFHRLTCAIEDAGFEIRDCMMWLYGSGFPKSLDVSKAIDNAAGVPPTVVGSRVLTGSAALTTAEKGGTYASNTSGAGRRKTVDVTRATSRAAKRFEGYGTALKPAWEPIIVARKPLSGTVAQNVQRWGCGALAIDACRVGHDEPAKTTARTAPRYSGRTMANGVRGGEQSNVAGPDPLGRWPANVILDEEAGAVLDVQSGLLHAHGKKRRGDGLGFHGGPARFFYCAKASRKERDAGLEGFEKVTRAEQTRRKEGSAGSKNPAAGSGSTEGGRNVHPTVKPLALTTYLARLILPPVEGSRLLVPFCGSGSEMLGGLRAGWSHVEGIDAWDVAVNIARARLAAA